MKSAEPSRPLAWALLAAVSLAAWGGTLASRAWVRDDRRLILENPLLAARAAGPLLATGWWQAVDGDAASVHQWRPVLSLSFLAQVGTGGPRQAPLRAANLLLHVLVAGLLFEALRRRHGARAALGGALLWAALPAHAEVAAYLTSRSEMLAALSVLSAWLLLGVPGRPRPWAGALAYLLGALSKEHALLFPAFLALADWVYAGAKPWEPGRRRVHAALGAVAAAVLAGRALVLPAGAPGGRPYFAGVPPLSRALTLSKFWVGEYAVKTLTGSPLCLDYGRPLIPDSGPGDGAAWLCLLVLAAGAALVLRGLARRRAWAFWAAGPALFLLPTSHLLLELDSIGAQRFLYLPAFSLAWAAGAAFDAASRRRPRAAAAGLCAALLFCCARARAQARIWSSELALYRAAAACNPVSAQVRAGLGAASLRAGLEDEGQARLLEALSLEPRFFPAAYDLALLAHRQGRPGLARRRLADARRLDPGAPEGVALEALFAEEDGRWTAAAEGYGALARRRPYDGAALYNHARALAALRRGEEAAAAFERFLALFPADPDAPAARRWLEARR